MSSLARHSSLLLLCLSSPGMSADDADLTAALTFHASFDRGLDADFARGDARLHTLTDRTTKTAKPGLHTEGKSALATGAGRFGNALEFKSGDAPWIFFMAKDNLTYTTEGWSGSVSLWLKCDPVNGLAPGYCDPFQLTSRTWDDAAFFVDFNKEGTPRDFRLGAFADRKVWNPGGGDLPESKRPLLTARHPKFDSDRWTHLLVTWEGFNTGRKDATAALYLDGKLNGTLTGWNQRFTWPKDETARLFLGLHYVGLLDEFSCFNRALTAEEVQRLHDSEKPPATWLLPKS